MKNETRQRVTISSKNGMMSVSIARRDANAKSSRRDADARGIRMQPAIAILHRRNSAFDNRAHPDFGEFHLSS
jgi:hypothetical protein